MVSKALILVDYENEWAVEHSEEYIGDVAGLVQKTNVLLDWCRKKNFKIIFTRHVEKGSEGSWSETSKGTQLLSSVHRKSSDIVITKHKINSFYKTTLEKELKGIRDIVVCGILTNMCVRSLVQDAYDRDFKITIISDCCKAFDDKTHNFTLNDLKVTREELTIVGVNEFVD